MSRTRGDIYGDYETTLCVIDSMGSMQSGQDLAALLLRYEFLAIKNGDVATIVRNCGCAKSRSFDSFKFFMRPGHQIDLRIKVVNIPNMAPYLLIGPRVPGENCWSMSQPDLEDLLKGKVQSMNGNGHASAHPGSEFEKELHAIAYEGKSPTDFSFDDIDELEQEYGHHPHTKKNRSHEEDEWSDARESLPHTDMQEPPFSGTLQELMEMYKASKAPEMGVYKASKAPGMGMGASGHYNEDGSVVWAGKGTYSNTLYCGKVKYPSSWIPINDDLLYPPDKTCGPHDGMQCIACKRVQDKHTIGALDQTNCYETFVEFADKWVESIDTVHEMPSGGAMRGASHRPPPLPKEVVHQFKVCNGKLNFNQGSKTIALTAIEGIEKACKSADLEYTIEAMEVLIGTVCCKIIAKRRCTGNKIELYMRFITKSLNVSPIDQYDATYTKKCNFKCVK